MRLINTETSHTTRGCNSRAECKECYFSQKKGRRIKQTTSQSSQLLTEIVQFSSSPNPVSWSACSILWLLTHSILISLCRVEIGGQRTYSCAASIVDFMGEWPLCA